MRKEAVDQASTKLEKARQAVAAMARSNDLQALEAAWIDFVKLEQGTKANASSEGWFSRKKHERKLDPLLSYIHHARNAEEHTIEPITERVSSSVAVKGRGAYRFDGILGRNANLKVTHLGGEPPQVETKGPHVRLVRIRDRGVG